MSALPTMISRQGGESKHLAVPRRGEPIYPSTQKPRSDDGIYPSSEILPKPKRYLRCAGEADDADQQMPTPLMPRTTPDRIGWERREINGAGDAPRIIHFSARESKYYN